MVKGIVAVINGITVDDKIDSEVMLFTINSVEAMRFLKKEVARNTTPRINSLKFIATRQMTSVSTRKKENGRENGRSGLY